MLNFSYLNQLPRFYDFIFVFTRIGVNMIKSIEYAILKDFMLYP
jgi:hypothetical protein